MRRIVIFIHNLFFKREWILVSLQDRWGETKIRVAKSNYFGGYQAEWYGGIISTGIHPVYLLPDGTVEPFSSDVKRWVKI